MLPNAYNLAYKAHFGQMYNNEPYVLHPVRVAFRVTNMWNTIEMQAAALLHDVLEDTEIGLEEIVNTTTEHIGAIVMLLTRKDTETYAEYIERLYAFPGVLGAQARTIKIADLGDNYDNLSRAPLEKQSLEKRYLWALDRLHNVTVHE